MPLVDLYFVDLSLLSLSFDIFIVSDDRHSLSIFSILPDRFTLLRSVDLKEFYTNYFSKVFFFP